MNPLKYAILARILPQGLTAEQIRDAFWEIAPGYVGCDVCSLGTWIHMHGDAIHVYFGNDGTRVVSTTIKGYGQELGRWHV